MAKIVKQCDLPSNTLWKISDTAYISKCNKIEATCECGEVHSVNLNNMLNGLSIQCKACATRKLHSTHRLSAHPLYTIWKDMRRRCYSETRADYKFYGARGVTICAEWRNDFKAFYDWALSNGWEKGLSIDKDKLSIAAKVYSPNTCRWISITDNIVLANRTSKRKVPTSDHALIKDMYLQGKSYSTIAKLYKVDPGTIGYIVTGKTSSLDE